MSEAGNDFIQTMRAVGLTAIEVTEDMGPEDIQKAVQNAVLGKHEPKEIPGLEPHQNYMRGYLLEKISEMQNRIVHYRAQRDMAIKLVELIEANPKDPDEKLKNRLEQLQIVMSAVDEAIPRE